MLPQRIYLYDDDPYERQVRRKDLERALQMIVTAALAMETHAVNVLPSIVDTGSRQELFDMLDAEQHACLVVADLQSRSRDDVGWIGARVLRSIAEDPVLNARCWRIALSKFASAEIASELEGHAHAMVHDDVRSVERHLARAIHTVTRYEPAKTTAITQHPATKDQTDWGGALRERVEQLVGADTKRGDEFILQKLIKNVPANVIDGELRRELATEGGDVGDRRTKVNDFLQAIKGHRGEPTTGGVHRLIAETTADLPARTIHQPLHADAVERASGVLTEVLPFARDPHKRHRLPADYYGLAVDFIISYRANAAASDSIRPNASSKRAIALRRTLEQEPFGDDLEGLQFAIWSLSDVVRAEGR